MLDDSAFHDLMRRVRAGDEAAAAEFVRTFEPEIRRYIHVRLTDPYLRRVLDSMDICQSVLANFFIRAALGQFEIERPEQLVKLLVTMARNRLLNVARKHRRERQASQGLGVGGLDVLEGVADASAGPGQIVAWRELLQKARGSLSAEERYLAEQRALGRDWATIAAEVGASPEALRKRLARASQRVMHELGLTGGEP